MKYLSFNYILVVILLSICWFKFDLANPCERCSNKPCKNNGVCTELNDPSRDEAVKCKCPKPFKGETCERWGKFSNSLY